jgi:hypothetical protein
MRSQALVGDLQAEVYDTIDNVIDSIFTSLDHDLSGGIEIEEYVNGFSHNSEVLNFLQAF